MEEQENTDLSDNKQLQFVVELNETGQRVDRYLGALGTEFEKPISRSTFNSLIQKGEVLVNLTKIKSSYRVKGGDIITVNIPEPESVDLIPEKVTFDILYEDSDIIVVCKPPGLVVHPACGHSSGTLVHGLLYHCSDLSGINGSIRPGIVHRLDKDTSGVLVVAKNDLAQRDLSRQFKAKTVQKKYLSLVHGCPKTPEGVICSNIGRHPVNRKKMAVVSRGGRRSVTNWKVLECFEGFSLVQLNIETGRTHQIRVHLASIGHPVVGDAVYGGRKHCPADLKVVRQNLHAEELTFNHPFTKDRLTFSAQLFSDMEYTLSLLRQSYR